MGKKSEKLEAAKAKSKAEKAPKSAAKTAVKIVPKHESKPLPGTSSDKTGKKAALVSKKKEVAKTKDKAPAKSTPPTFDEIQREAYHIAQKRMAAGIDGTAASDWIEAEKALLAAHDL